MDEGLGGEASAPDTPSTTTLAPPRKQAGAVRRVAGGRGWSGGTGSGLVGLVDGQASQPLPPQPWESLNAVHAVLGGLATLTGRALAMPAPQP